MVTGFFAQCIGLTVVCDVRQIADVISENNSTEMQWACQTIITISLQIFPLIFFRINCSSSPLTSIMKKQNNIENLHISISRYQRKEIAHLTEIRALIITVYWITNETLHIDSIVFVVYWYPK